MKKQKKPSRMEQVAARVAQTHAHESTEDIRNRRDVLAFESVVADQEIVALQARLANARARRASIEASLIGLGLVIGKR